jgi:hypothetical protein
VFEGLYMGLMALLTCLYVQRELALSDAPHMPAHRDPRSKQYSVTRL